MASIWHWIISDAAIVGALTFLWQTWVRHSFAKMIERSKFNFNRLAANASLYSSKRHDAYVQMSRSLLEAQGNIAERLNAVTTSPTFEDYNEEDIDDFLAKRNVTRHAIDEIRSLWVPNRPQALRNVETYLKIYHRYQTQLMVSKAQNDSLYLDLYLSDEVSAQVRDIVRKMRECTTHLNGYGYWEQATHMSSHEKATSIADEIHELMNALTQDMKQEIRKGYFEEDDKIRLPK